MTRQRFPATIHNGDPNEHALSQSSAPHLDQILQARLSRRDTLRGGLGLAATTLFAGAGLSGCSDGNDDIGGGAAPAQLGFQSIAGSAADAVGLPAGYRMQVLIPWGTPITGSFPAFAPDGSNSAADQAQQVGSWHDGMRFFPIGEGEERSRHGLLVLNHENLSRNVFFPDGRTQNSDGLPTDPDQVRKEINAHGISIVELQADGDGRWEVVQSGFNRRITAATEMILSGPAAGSRFFVTPFSPDGTLTRGTFNNCGRGFTPWETYLSGEENIQGYFITTESNPPREKARYGLTRFGFGFFWHGPAGSAGEVDGEFARFDTTPTGSGPTADYRNEANGAGWVVEVDPFDPSSTPVKRTALGRFRHEGVEPSPVQPGRRIAFYMGDDAQGEYFYKFVTAAPWDPDNRDPDMLDSGTLYVAVFSADGSGEWRALDIGNPALQADFADQADVLVNTRTAADTVGATPMDRPEWAAIDPVSGEVYLTLTNNTRRGVPGEEQPDAANPRADNTHGHIIRLRENGDDPAAETFTWDIFVFGSNAGAEPDFNRSGLTLDNEFGGPDGLWFDPRGVLWIQTDNGAPLDSETNDQMLAVIPARLEGDRTVNPANQASLKRFLVGPVGCEVTGADMTPDHRTMFINIQHPGGGSTWPDGGEARPRSATVVISRTDGGEIAL